MAVGNGITVQIKDRHNTALQELAQTANEPRSFRYRFIAAAPGTRFIVSVTVEERFHWMGADTLFVAIAYDDGEHLSDSGVTQAWVLSKDGSYLGEHFFKYVSTWETNNAARRKTAYLMPAAVDCATPEIDFDSVRHRSKDTLVAHRGCISVYVHRGSFSLNAEKRRPADPPAAALSGTSIEEQKQTRINFESFEPLLPKTGNVCEFHFRNIVEEEFGQVLTPGHLNRKIKDTPSAKYGSENGETLDTAVARTSLGLRGLQQVNYSLSETWERHGFPWNEDIAPSSQTREESAPSQMRERRKKRRLPVNESTATPVQEKRTRPKLIDLGDGEDNHDGETVVHAMGEASKSESHEEESIPVRAMEEQSAADSCSNSLASGNKINGDSKERRELEMELEEIELEKRAIQIKKRLLTMG